MSYIVISDFRFGLDKRRLDLANRPGALTDLVNAHITNGGEIEKRKAFVRTQIVSSIDPTVPTKGFQEGPDGIYVFGNIVDPGGWPTGIKYQRLQYPEFHATNNTFIPVVTVAVDSILASTVFGGKIFVVAKFVTGEVFAYYDGVALSDIYAGRKWSALQLNTGLLADLLVAIQATGLYTGDQPGGTPTTLNVYSLPGRLYNLTLSETSALGTLSASFVDNGSPSSPAITAVGSFQIVNGTEAAGHQITQISVGGTNLLTGVVLYNDDNTTTAANVVSAINANSIASGINATSNENVVTLYGNTAGTALNGAVVIVTTAGDVCIGLCRIAVAGTGFTLDYVKVNGVSLTTAVLTYPTPASETLTAFCVRVVANINANSGTSGYLSAASSNSIYLSKLVTSSSDLDQNVEFSVTPTTGTGTGGIGTIPELGVSLDEAALYAFVIGSQVVLFTGTVYTFQTGNVTALTTGGAPPLKFKWRFTDAPSAPSVLSGYPVSPTSQSTSFIFQEFAPGSFGYNPFAVHAVCDVTDAFGATVTSPPVLIRSS